MRNESVSSDEYGAVRLNAPANENRTAIYRTTTFFADYYSRRRFFLFVQDAVPRNASYSAHGLEYDVFGSDVNEPLWLVHDWVVL